MTTHIRRMPVDVQAALRTRFIASYLIAKQIAEVKSRIKPTGVTK